jgi:transcriptional regulator with PAS, ATPase and Fis domain
LAHKGTLFLDEIGDIPPAVQVRLLRVLQERSFHRVGGNDEIHVDVRIIAATNEDLESLVKERRFRRDLFYRLNVIPLRLPPLRERQEDIPLLVEHFIQKTRIRHPHPIQEITPEALEYLMAHGWPGNIRELENVIERAVALAGDRTQLTPELLPRELTKGGPQGATALGGLFDQLEWQQISQFMGEEGTIDSLMNHFEWRIVQQAIQGHGGNKSRAARALKRSYRWLRKLEKRIEQEGHPLL